MAGTEISGGEELTKFIERSLEFDCKLNTTEVFSRKETCPQSNAGNDSKSSSDAPNCSGSNSIDEAEDFESSGYMQNFSNSSLESEQPSTSDQGQDDLEHLPSKISNLIEDPSSLDCLMDPSTHLGSLVHKLKDILQQVDELLEAMDSRPHWNRLVGKSNSPWKQNSHVDLDSGVPADKKPKILKQWTETRLKFSRLSASLKTLLQPSKSSLKAITLLTEVKDVIIECVDLNKVQECLNLSENILDAFDTNSDVRYMYNLERRILTIEVTLNDITFEIDKFFEEC